MAAVSLGQKDSLQPEVVEDKELSTPVSALERNQSVTARQPSLPASCLIESNKGQEPGDMQDLGTKPGQDSQSTHNPQGIRSSLAPLPSSTADKKPGKAKRWAKVKAKKKAGREQAQNKSKQVVQQQVGVEQALSTAGVDDHPGEPSAVGQNAPVEDGENTDKDTGQRSTPGPTSQNGPLTRFHLDRHSTTTTTSHQRDLSIPTTRLNGLTHPGQDTRLEAAMLGNKRPSGRDPSQSVAVYKKFSSQNVVDLDKFETEPLQRDSRGFQPRASMSQGEPSVAPSLTTELPSFTGPQEVANSEANAQSRRVDEWVTSTVNELDIDRVSENSGSAATVRPFQVASGVGMATQASGNVQPSVDSAADKKPSVEATNKTTHSLISRPPGLSPSDQALFELTTQSSSQAPRVGPTSQSLNPAPGLEASMWAPKQKQKTLHDSPGLRQRAAATSTWDDSGYYTIPVSTGQRISLNLFHRHAWNGGVKPQSSQNPGPSTNAATPHSGPGGSKAAVTTARPTPGQTATVGISERVPNTPGVLTHAEVAEATKGQGLVKTPRIKVAGENPPNGHYIPPHLRTSEPQLLEPKKEQNSANIMASPKAKSPDSAELGELHVESPSVVPVSPGAESSLNGLSRGNAETSVDDGGPLTLATTMTSAAITVNKNRQTLDDAGNKLAPHLRAPKPSSAMPVVTEYEPTKDQANGQIPKLNREKGSQKAGMNGISKPDKNAATDGNEKGSSTRTFLHDGPSSKMQKDKQKSNEVQGWDKPFKPAHPLLGWDNKPAEHPVDWEGRSREPIPAMEQTQILKSWAEASEAVFDEASTNIDTSLPEFALGTGIIHDRSLSSGLTDQAHFTRRLPNDPLTLARAEQTAQLKIEEYKAKKQEEVTEPQLTKQEQRQLRREMRQRDEEFAKIPNPYKPKADIYIRPAQTQDLAQMVEIYNHYVKTSAVALELDPLDRDTWRLRMEDCRREGYNMFVAVQKAAQGNGRNRRDQCEPIFGFGYAEDQNDKRSSCRFTAIAQVYVSWKHLRIGVGRCLLDRVMAMLNVNHHHRQGVDWVGETPMVQREVKKVLIEIPYWDDSEEERAVFRLEKNRNTGLMDRVPGWKARFLEKVQFEYAGTLKEIGFKQGSHEKGRTVSIATFMLDTYLDISTKRDVQ